MRDQCLMKKAVDQEALGAGHKGVIIPHLDQKVRVMAHHHAAKVGLMVNHREVRVGQAANRLVIALVQGDGRLFKNVRFTL